MKGSRNKHTFELKCHFYIFVLEILIGVWGGEVREISREIPVYPTNYSNKSDVVI